MRTQECVPDEGQNTSDEDFWCNESKAWDHVSGNDRRSHTGVVGTLVARHPAALQVS